MEAANINSMFPVELLEAMEAANMNNMFPMELLEAMEAANINNLFPVELLEAIFLNLPPSDLKAAVSICSTWRLVGDHTKFWSWVSLKVTDENLAGMPQAVGVDRLQNMKELDVMAVSTELLEAIYSHPSLEVLKARCSFSIVDPILVGKVVCNLQEVHFGFENLSTEQCKTIFKLANEESKLKKLQINGNDLSEVDVEDLAGLVVKLEDVNLGNSQLTEKQCQTIFEVVRSSSQSKLRCLNMSGNNLFEVNPQSLALVVTRLEEVDLTDTQVNLTQRQIIFTFVSYKSKLKHLKMSAYEGLHQLHKATSEALLRLAAELEVI